MNSLATPLPRGMVYPGPIGRAVGNRWRGPFSVLPTMVYHPPNCYVHSVRLRGLVRMLDLLGCGVGAATLWQDVQAVARIRADCRCRGLGPLCDAISPTVGQGLVAGLHPVQCAFAAPGFGSSALLLSSWGPGLPIAWINDICTVQLVREGIGKAACCVI